MPSLRRIAVVDDDPSVLRALKRTLRVRTYQPKTYSSAHDFLASLPEGLPECLIVDLQMPEMTGLELHRHLTSRGIQIPTIIITAYEDAIARERFESVGVSAVLTKPLGNALLFHAIEAAIGTEG